MDPLVVLGSFTMAFLIGIKLAIARNKRKRMKSEAETERKSHLEQMARRKAHKDYQKKYP